MQRGKIKMQVGSPRTVNAKPAVRAQCLENLNIGLSALTDPPVRGLPTRKARGAHRTRAVPVLPPRAHRCCCCRVPMAHAARLLPRHPGAAAVLRSWLRLRLSSLLTPS